MRTYLTNRRGILVFGLIIGAAAAAEVPASAAPQDVQATFVASGSFDLPRRGQPGGVDRPSAIALSPDGSIHVADRDGAVHVYAATGAPLASYGQNRLRHPVALTLSPTGLSFVLDTDQRQVLVFAADGQFLHAIGRRGGRGGELSEPRDLAIGPSGFVYVLDTGRKGVQIFSQDGTFVRDIPFGEVIQEPLSLSVGRDGTIYVVDRKTPTHLLSLPPFTRIRWAGGLPRLLVQQFPIFGGRLEEAVSMAANDRGTVLIVERKSGRLYRRNPQADGDQRASDAVYGGKGSGRGAFEEAVSVAFATHNEALVLDARLRKIERIRLTTEDTLSRQAEFGFPVRVTRVAAGLPAPLLAVQQPAAAPPRFLLKQQADQLSLISGRAEGTTTIYGDSAVVYVPDPAGPRHQFTQELDNVAAAALTDSTVVVVDPGRDRFAIFRPEMGRPLGTFGDNYRDDRRLKDPWGVALLPDGRIVIADTGNDRVKIFNADLASLLGSYPVLKPVGIAVAPDGEIYVWNEDGRQAGRLDTEQGRLEPLPPAVLSGPVGALAFDASGNLFILNRDTRRITIVEAGLQGVLIQLGDEDGLDRPTALSLDRQGNIYIADEGAGRTVVYRWDIHLPAVSGFGLEYQGGSAILSWEPVPPRFTRGYEVEGSSDAAGPFHLLGTAAAPPYRIDAASLPEVPPRYVRVVPVFTTGGRGYPSETMPLSYFAASAAFERGDYQRALQEATAGLRLIEEGVLLASDEVKGSLLLVCFTSAYRLGDLQQAVDWARQAAQVPMPRADLFEFLHSLAQLYLDNGNPREARQHVLTLIDQGPPPSFYSRPEVVEQSFRIFRELRDAGLSEDALAFIRYYARAVPDEPQALKFSYEDSVIVFSARHKLASGFQYWRNVDYGQVVTFFEGMLAQGGLSVEEETMSLQMLASAYYAFGRRVEAEATFRQVFVNRPDFNLDREIGRLERLYNLTIYNPETHRFFGNLGPRSQ